MNEIETVIERADYRDWFVDLKRRYRATQVKAAVAVNSLLTCKSGLIATIFQSAAGEFPRRHSQRRGIRSGTRPSFGGGT